MCHDESIFIRKGNKTRELEKPTLAMYGLVQYDYTRAQGRIFKSKNDENAHMTTRQYVTFAELQYIHKNCTRQSAAFP